MTLSKAFKAVVLMMITISSVKSQTVYNVEYVAGTNLDGVTPSGQLALGNGYNLVQAPFGSTNYWHILSMRHHNPANNFVTQIAGEFFGNRLAFRNNQNSNNVAWNEIYHSGNLSTFKTAFANSGNIGIGTTTPQEKLSVNGKIRAHEVKVETTNWPDYVFEENYKLVTLKDLDRFIKSNKHLPQMPTAVSATANGIELGEMNKLLVKKIEELTLHLIEKDKQIDTLALRLEAIEKLLKK